MLMTSFFLLLFLLPFLFPLLPLIPLLLLLMMLQLLVATAKIADALAVAETVVCPVAVVAAPTAAL